MPVLFVTVIEGIRHLIRQHISLAAHTRIEPISLARSLLAPRTTFLLARRMVLWHGTSYRDGFTLEYRRLLAVSRRQHCGRWQWGLARATLQDRLALRLMAADTVPTLQADKEPQLDDSAMRLIEATTPILAAAERDETTLSQVALARQLRECGYRVGNDRLRRLVTSARAQARPLHLARRLRRIQGHPDGPPRTRHARQGFGLRPRHRRHSQAGGATWT
jgi:hypothetical protein